VDVILSDNSYQSLLATFRLTAGRAALASVSVCRESGSITSQERAAKSWFNVLKLMTNFSRGV